MLQLDRLELAYGGWHLRADLAIPKGAICGLIGPSGAGKSTLLAAIAGFETPVTGRILWEGRDLGPLAPGDRPVSILFQDQNLFPHLSLERNLGLAIDPRLRLSPADRERIGQVLDRVGLAGFGERRPATLSGGQQARAALARAALRARPLLLLDEPFAALGPALRREMLDLVAGLSRETGATVLLVSHTPEDIRRIAGLTVLVADGEARPPVPTEAIFAHPPAVLRDYLGQ
jgi:thiamine transport system ATP-binding protein